MNTSSHRPNLSTVQTVRSERGFALVIALSLMAFILLLLLSITTFVAVETKNAAASKERLRAEQNALLAAMQAIGQLQKELGPDQRITATASVLELYADDDSNGVADSTLVHPQWLGSWSAWDSWLTDIDSDGHTLASTYTQGRSNKFNRWLVSHPLPTDLENAAALTVPASNLAAGIELVKLVGENTLGASADPSLQVEAPRVSLADDRGGYAWWVGGENQKAAVVVSPASQSTLDDLHARSQWPTSAPEGIEGLSALAVTSSEWERIHDFESFSLPTGAQSVREALKANFHDLTVQSSGVLANVRNGGLKKDLNLLLESETLPAEFGIASYGSPSSPDFNSGTTVSIRPHTGDVPDPQNTGSFSKFPSINKKPNFTSWYKLHQYYSLYKTGMVSEAGQDRVFDSNGPMVERHFGAQLNYPYLQFGHGYDIYPVISRRMNVFSAVGPEEVLNGGSSYSPRKFEYKMYLTPVISFWNPYNVRLRFTATPSTYASGPNSINIDNKTENLEYKVYLDGSQEFDWRTFTFSFFLGERQTDTSGNSNDAHMSGKMRLRVAEQLDNGDLRQSQSTPIVLEPGQNRMFSIRGDAITATEAYLTPGYDGPSLDGGFPLPINDGDSDLNETKTNNDGSFAVFYDGLIVDEITTDNGDGTFSSRIPVATMAVRMIGEDTTDQYAFGLRDPWANEVRGSTVPKDGRIDIIADVDGERLVFPNSSTPIPGWTVEYFLKSGERPETLPIWTASDIFEEPDHRNKSFIHSDPTNLKIDQGRATDRLKSVAQYTYRVYDGAGNQFNPDVIGEDGGLLGSAVTAYAANDYAGQTRVILNEIPTTPITSMASLMHFKLSPGAQGVRDHGSTLHDAAPNQALAIGNAFAHPLIPSNSVYQRIQDLPGLSQDVYDHAYFNNDALWDEWFFSTIAPQNQGVYAATLTLNQVVTSFIAGTSQLPSKNLSLWNGDLSQSEVQDLLINVNDSAADAWNKVSSHLLLNGAFNINSTSVAAWKAFLWGLRDTEINYVDPSSGGIQQASVPADRVVLSRFTLPASAGEGADAGDPNAWLGIRLLTEQQVSKLARECVRQVKLRGPFLNLADFVNRRLEDSELGQVGALQAAIDWDEWNGNSPIADANDSINGRFKNAVDLIADADVTYPSNTAIHLGNPALPNPEAATGSRWAGIPGYVTQADLLKRIGNQITVRDDTFRIRAYGDTKDLSGNTVARAWCEVVVQRVPDYLASVPDDGSNTATDAAGDLAHEPLQVQDTNSTLYSLIANPDLLAINQQFGRRFVIKSFRWLNANDI
jgi:hypothetical protein